MPALLTEYISIRWNVLFKHFKSLENLKNEVVNSEGHDGPCVSGLRSICWKVLGIWVLGVSFAHTFARQVFLLLGDFDRARWQKLLADSRSAYDSLKELFLRSINHPEAVDSTMDPLTDDDDVRTVVVSCLETYVDLGLSIMSD